MPANCKWDLIQRLKG